MRVADRGSFLRRIRTFSAALGRTLSVLRAVLRSLFTVGVRLVGRKETLLYPDEPLTVVPRFRGKIILTCDPAGSERCVACGLCAAVCPVRCITLQKGERDGRWYPENFRVDFSRCIFCGLCEESCPTSAIQLSADFELSSLGRQDLLYEKEDLMISGPGRHREYDLYARHGKDADDVSGVVDVKSLLP